MDYSKARFFPVEKAEMREVTLEAAEWAKRYAKDYRRRQAMHDLCVPARSIPRSVYQSAVDERGGDASCWGTGGDWTEFWGGVLSGSYDSIWTPKGPNGLPGLWIQDCPAPPEFVPCQEAEIDTDNMAALDVAEG